MKKLTYLIVVLAVVAFAAHSFAGDLGTVVDKDNSGPTCSIMNASHVNEAERTVADTKGDSKKEEAPAVPVETVGEPAS